MRTILIASGAIVAGAIGSLALAQNSNMPPKVPPGLMQERVPQGTFGFFAASQPANSNRVGIFVARRMPGKQPELYYCSSPIDAKSADPTACKHIDGFPPE